MSRRLWGPLTNYSILVSPHLWRLQLVLLIIVQITSTTDGQGSFFRSLMSVPDQCTHNGVVSQCTFVISCFLDGGTPKAPCGGGFLYRCCSRQVVSVRSDVGNDIQAYNFYREMRNRNHRGKNNIVSAHHNDDKIRSFRPSSFSSQRDSWPPKYIPVHQSNRHKKRVNIGFSPLTLEDDLLQESEYPSYNEPECGIQKTKQFAKRIIGGNEATFGELPWQAHIRISGYQCGGVLLNRYFVATAAHCVHKARLSQITVHLGEYDTKNTGDYFEPFPRETFEVLEKRTHPRFKYMLTQPDRYDVAVLRLSRPAPYRENIVPICLPEPTDDFEGHVGVVAGWGKTDTSFGKTGTNILRKVLVPIIDNKECLRWHHLKSIDVKLYHEMFCAGHPQGQMDACLGDSGGPLVVKYQGRWHLAGITSAGFGCAVDHQPGIYHKVSVTTRWIAANIHP